MTERKVTYRVGIDGAGQVRREMHGIGEAGELAYEKLVTGSTAATREAAKLERVIEREQRSYQSLRAAVDPTFASMMRMQKVEAQLARQVEIGVVSRREANDVLRMYETRTRSAAAASEMLDTAHVRVSGGARNALLQINQLGQQAAATGDVMGALAIQMPDILGGFGGLPALIAGAAVGLGAAFIPKLMESRNETKALEQDLMATFGTAQSAADAAREAQDRYTAAIALTGPAQSLVTGEILQNLQLEAQAREALAELERMKLEDQRRAAEQALASERRELENLISVEIAASRRPPLRGRETEVEITARVREENEAIVRSIQRQQAELDLVNALLGQNGDEASTFVDSLIEAQAASESVAGAVGGVDFGEAIQGARALSAELGITLHQAMQIRGLVGGAAQARNAETVYDPRDPRFDAEAARLGRMRDQMGAMDAATVSPFDTDRMRQEAEAAAKAASRGARSGGSSGGSRATKVDPREREAAQVIKEIESARVAALSATQRYNEELRDLQELERMGYLSASEYASAVSMIETELRDTRFEPLISGIDQVSDSMARAVIEGKGVQGALAAVGVAAQQAAQQVLASGLRNLLMSVLVPGGGAGGGFLSGLFGGGRRGLPSFDGGGSTGDGLRTGGIDGRGGFLAINHPNETIIDHSRGQGMGGVNVVVNNAPAPVDIQDDGIDAQGRRNLRFEFSAMTADAMSARGSDARRLLETGGVRRPMPRR